ncbi:MAG: HAMP domain-containing histidine kinase [Candidatus Nitrosotenuis sp.]|nr:HAMP domain-containing histidine kinase [Candidatus Nitrosotenuis sp.]
MAKFINKKSEEAQNRDGRVIFFSKTPPDPGETEGGKTDTQQERTEFSKLVKNQEEKIFEEKKKDRIATVTDLIEEEKKAIANIQVLIKKQSQSLERARKLFREKQSMLDAELNRKSSMFTNDKFNIMGHLSSKMAHDIRNPLNVIKVQVDLLKLRYSKQEDTMMLDSLNRMEKAVYGITNQLNDVLNFLRESPMQCESVSFLKILEESLSYIQKPDNVRIDMPSDDVMLFCDANKMQRVFVNMIQNSMQAMENGGTITFSIMDGQSETKIEISDTGKGINEELLPKIFEPLFTTKNDGTGLGLPICKKIIEDHGGSISVRNGPTTFTMTLPKSEPS